MGHAFGRDFALGLGECIVSFLAILLRAYVGGLLGGLAMPDLASILRIDVLQQHPLSPYCSTVAV